MTQNKSQSARMILSPLPSGGGVGGEGRDWLRAAKAPPQITFEVDLVLEAAAEGRRPTFHIDAYTGGLMRVKPYPLPLVVDLSTARAHADELPALKDHDPDQLVGQGTPTINASGITFDGTITGENEPTQEIVSHAKNGFKWKASIGGTFKREDIAAGVQVKVNGKTFTGPIHVARNFVLSEVSFTKLGADPKASAHLAASQEGTDKMDFEAWLEAKGFDATTLTDDGREFLQAQFDAEQNPPATKPKPKKKPKAKPVVEDDDLEAANEFDELDDVFAESKREQARKREIAQAARRATTRYPKQIEKIEAAARLAYDDETATPKDFELSILRACLPETGGHAGRQVVEDGIDDTVLEAALCMSLKMEDALLTKRFKEHTLEAAHKHWPGGIQLSELLLRGASQNGFKGVRIGRNEKSVLKAAFADADELQASGAFSSISVAGILSNVANKRIIDAYNAVEQIWRQISVRRTVNDFKTVTSYGLTGNLKYEKLGPDGEIKHGTIGEEEFTNRAETYAKMLAITRTDIRNDDLGAFDRVMDKLGRGGALQLNTVFWAEFLDDAAFFLTGNGNYDAGTDTALDAAGLAAAVVLVDAQTDPDGYPLGSDPTILLCSPTQWKPAMTLMNSTHVNTGGSSSTAEVPNANIYAGMFRVLKSKYLSGLPWYLLRDPADIPVMEVCFLDGVETPMVDQAEADFHQLGIQMRGVYDFGCAKQNPLAGYKFKGEN